MRDKRTPIARTVIGCAVITGFLLLALYVAQKCIDRSRFGRVVSASTYYELALRNPLPRQEQMLLMWDGRYIQFRYSLDMKIIHVARVAVPPSGRPLSPELQANLDTWDAGFDEGWRRNALPGRLQEIQTSHKYMLEPPDPPEELADRAEFWESGFRHGCTGSYRWEGVTRSGGPGPYWW